MNKLKSIPGIALSIITMYIGLTTKFEPAGILGVTIGFFGLIVGVILLGAPTEEDEK